MKLEALLFDVDGTLADTERDGHRPAFNRAFREVGLDWDWDPERYGELLAVTGGKERIAHYIAVHRPEFGQKKNLSTFIADLHARKTRHYLALLAEGQIPLRPGVGRLIREARREGIRLAIATTTTPANVSALLRSTLGDDSESWFDVIGAGDIVPAKKPAPDIYVWVLRQMGLSPDACMVLEDSEHGVQAAHGAGLKSILVTVNEYTRDQNFSKAPYVVDQLGEPQAPMHCLRGEVDVTQFLGIADLRRLHFGVVSRSR